MKKLVLTSALCVLSLAQTSCAHMGMFLNDAEGGTDVTTAHVGQPQPQVWFKGSVEEAFKAAAKEKKMVFLYWGAVWCPPCNELKEQIFSKPRFAELMANFIPVYLDGDTEAAQIWGDRFQASGYPTVMVMDETKKELFRMNAAISIEEFDGVIQSLVASSGSLERAGQAVSDNRAKHRDLQLLAYTSWNLLPEDKWPASRRINVLEQAFESSEISTEKSIFASTWLSQVAAAKGHLSDKQLEKAFAALFVDSESIWASREFLKAQAGATLEWLEWKPKDQKFQYLRSEWLKAAAQLEANPQSTVLTRLGSVNPEIEFYQYEHPNEKLPQSLVSKAEIAARHADEDAKSNFDRHAVISDAAFLLGQVGSYDRARLMLETELKSTNTPWYYQSSLSALEAKRGDIEAAKKWSALARKSVQGRASKIQWITSDLLLNAKEVKDAKASQYLNEVTREFYRQALSLNDGFAGRNWTRAKKVQDALTPYKAEALFKKTFAEFAPRCQKLSGESQKNCEEHFAALQ
ncbi:MAG: thioredoxin family protein [Chitinophagaceae bacterium]|nr:thioredoxin family protein [Oligoflexus sp.]